MGKAKLVPAAGAQDDLDPSLMRPAEGSAVLLGKLDLGVEQGAIDIDGDEPNRAGHNSILSAAPSHPPSHPSKVRMRMELRKDPITRSWVITGDEHEKAPRTTAAHFVLKAASICRSCQFVPSANGNPWAARAVVHPRPIYRIEGEPERAGNGLYDKMQAVGAHEVIVENTRHDRHLWNAEDREIEEYLALLGSRIDDLKKDLRFKYVTVFKNFGGLSGQQWDHPTTEIVATTFVPRRVLYELRAAREHYHVKERCVFCDILAQEQQQKIRRD